MMTTSNNQKSEKKRTIKRLGIVLLTAFFVCIFMSVGASADYSLQLPSGITIIEEGSFSGDTSISSVIIPKGVVRIKRNAFSGCSSIHDVVFDGTMDEWNSIDIDSGNEPILNAQLHCKIIEGLWGTCRWDISEDGVLTVHAGQGADSEATGADYWSPWDQYKNSIRSVVMDEEIYFPMDCHGLFAGLQCESVSLKGIHTQNLRYARSMFSGCTKLKSLDLSNMDTSQVTSMFSMFAECTSLKNLNIENFDTSNVRDMSFMFYRCYSLEELRLSHFNTSKVEYADGVFSDCIGLKTLDIQQFDTHKANYMESFFHNCYHLTSVTVGNGFTFMGNQNRVLAMLPAGNWYSCMEDQFFSESEIAETRNEIADTYTTVIPSVIASGTWGTCEWTLNQNGTLHINQGMGENTNGISPWDDNVREKVVRIEISEEVILPEDSSRLFSRFSNCETMDLSGVNTASVINMKEMFLNNSRLQELDLSMFVTNRVINMQSMFGGCENLEALNVDSFDTGKVTNMSVMFYACRKLRSIDISGFDTGKVTEMWDMFSYCEALREIDTSRFDTSGVTSMDSMFYNCSNLQTLDMSGFDTSNVTNMSSLFSGCKGLRSLDLGGFNTSGVTNMSSMFYNCASLTRLDLGHFDTSNVTTMRAMFSRCKSLKTLNITGFNTTKVTDMEYMFEGCRQLAVIDVSGFDTQNVMTINWMFSGCENVEVLNLQGFVISNPEEFICVFNNCGKLKVLNLTGFVLEETKDVYNALQGCNSLECITVGNRFSFRGRLEDRTMNLPDKRWFADSDGEEYTSAEIENNRNLIADTYRTDDGFDYSYDNDTYCTVIGYHGQSKSLKIRENSPDGHIVHAIGAHAFADRTDLTGEVIISNTVETIGDKAFSGCSGLTGNLVIPSSVRSIGNSSFENCTGLNGTLTLGNNLETIGTKAFRYCSFTGSLVFPNSLKSIGSFAFSNCRGFSGTLRIPKQITVVNDSAFAECTGFDGNLIIEEGITSIGSRAFGSKYPNHFTGDLVIPDSVTYIGERAFEGCGCNGTLTISKNITEIREATFHWTRFTGSLTIPHGVVSIGYEAFMHSSFTGTLSLPDTLVSIDKEAFFSQGEDHPFTGNLTIPNSVKSLGDMAFSGCGFNGRLLLSESVSVIPMSCFSSNYFTGRLHIPASVRKIEDGAFSNNLFTGDLIIPDTVTYAAGFSNCTFDGNLVLSRNLTVIPNYMFQNCSNLKGNIDIPEGVTEIGYMAFYGCSGFDGELTLPGSLVLIRNSAFMGCSSLNGNLFIPNKVTTIGTDAFKNCSSIDGYISIGEKMTQTSGKPFSGTDPIMFLLKKDSYAEMNANVFGFTPYQILEDLDLLLAAGTAGVEEDDPIFMLCTTTGGVKPYEYKYEVNISDGSYYYTDWRTNSSTTFYPVTDGYYTITVTVRDALGNTKTKTSQKIYRHLLTEGESNARNDRRFAQYMNSRFFSDIPEPTYIAGYLYFQGFDDIYPWVVQFIEYLSKFNPLNPSYYIELYNNLFNQTDAKEYLLEQALVMCSTGEPFKMYNVDNLPDAIKQLNSFAKLKETNTTKQFLDILHNSTHLENDLVDSVFNDYLDGVYSAGDLPGVLDSMGIANENNYVSNSMTILRDFKEFQNLLSIYNIGKSIYDDLIVDTINTLALFDVTDQGQLSSLAEVWMSTGNQTQKEVGGLLKNLVSTDQRGRLEMLITKNSYKALIGCWGKLTDIGIGKLIKLEQTGQGISASTSMAYYTIATSILELFAGQETYADRFQELETSSEIVQTAWNQFYRCRNEYRANPSNENFERVIYASMNYLQSAVASEKSFINLVIEARQHILLQEAGYGQPMLEAAQHAQDHVEALNTFVKSIRQTFKDWKAVDNHDYWYVEDKFYNAISEYKKWHYESWSQTHGGW